MERSNSCGVRILGESGGFAVPASKYVEPDAEQHTAVTQYSTESAQSTPIGLSGVPKI
jgi:hypothetical protein